ncbi:MAG: hypothetical protein Q7U57_14435 [Methylovulum sp.]|nr:hypothetical protein [Methylovulum sp.]
MAIDTLPAAPAPTDTTSEFNAKSFAWVAALATWTTQANALEENVDALEATTVSNAAIATTKAAESTASASAALASQTAAAASQTAAANSATQANVSSTTAIGSANTATTKATEASTSAVSAAASAAAANALVTGTASARPTIRPSLLLDFANTKKLDPRITFTRASSARFYDSKTVAKAEENLLLQSQTIASAPWDVTGATVSSNSTAAPDGTVTADTLTETTATGSHTLGQVFTPISGATYSASVSAKNVNGQYVYITVRGAASNYFSALFDLFTGVVTSSSALGSGFSVTSTAIVESPVGSGWYRCQITGVIGTTVSSPNVYIGLSDASALTSSGFPSYTGTSRSIILWGAQIEQRSSVTAYTATTTQPITNYIPVLQTALDNVARFEHNPVTVESLGLFEEEQRTNLLLRSEDFSIAPWGAGSGGNPTISINQNIAPDGTLTADLLGDNSAIAVLGRLQNAVITSGTTVYTGSVYAKQYSSSIISVRVVAGGGTAVVSELVVNLSNGSAQWRSGVPGTSFLVTPVGNGWYRIAVSITDNASGNNVLTLELRPAFASTYADILNVAATGLAFFWGAQLEAGSQATSYIKTEAAQVTRSADAPSMEGVNFSSWYSAAEGTLVAEYFLGADNTAVGVVYLDNGVSTNSIQMRYAAGTQAQFIVNTNGTAIVSLAPFGYSTPGLYKRAISFKTNSFQQAINGILPNSETTLGVAPEVSVMLIGRERSGGQLNGTIKRLAFYPKRLANAQLQALTA